MDTLLNICCCPLEVVWLLAQGFLQMNIDCMPLVFSFLFFLYSITLINGCLGEVTGEDGNISIKPRRDHTIAMALYCHAFK